MEMEMEMKMKMKWCSRLPKIELHAHLNGSIRDSTLLELAKVLGDNGVVVSADVQNVIMKIQGTVQLDPTNSWMFNKKGTELSGGDQDDRSLVECFRLFDLIHVLTTKHETVTRITREVIEDFASENIVYVELRTTPKNNEAKGMTKRSYVEAVIDGLKTVDTVDVSFMPNMELEDSKRNAYSDGITRKQILVRLLLSIDRRETAEAAMETVQLALEMKDLGVVGIDLSGNPSVGEWDTYLPALRFAKEEGLPITLHCGEVANRKEEVQAMLDFLPHRIGHAIFLEKEQWRQLKMTKIPVEICLTSNIRTECVMSIHDHHFVDLYKSKHPISLCTDDSGVFSTSLSHEYSLAASAFNIGSKEMFELGRNAIEYVFSGEGVKKYLRKIFDSTETEFLQ